MVHIFLYEDSRASNDGFSGMKKIPLIPIIGVIIIIALAIRGYERDVAWMRENPKQAYTAGIMGDGNLTLLHMASWDGDYSKVSRLLEQGHDIYQKTSVFRFTPFHMAIFRGHTRVAGLLLSKGANINGRSNFNQTPLHWAAFMAEPDSVEFLIRKGADLEKSSEQGWTALHYAAHAGNLDIVKLLVESGVQIHKKTHQGQTARELAEVDNREDVVRFLGSVTQKPN